MVIEILFNKPGHEGKSIIPTEDIVKLNEKFYTSDVMSAEEFEVQAAERDKALEELVEQTAAKYIESVNDPELKMTGTMTFDDSGDDKDLAEDAEETKNEVLTEALDETYKQMHADEEYFYNKITAALQPFVNSEGEEIEDYKSSNLYGMDKETFLTWLSRVDFERSYLYIKNSLEGVFVDTPVEEATEEHVANVLGHLGYVSTYSEERKLWEVPLYLRGFCVIVQDKSQANALLRAFITRREARLANNNDLTDTIVKYWKHINDVKEDPRIDKANLNDIAKSLGTSIEEIEQHYEDAVNANKAE